MQVRLLPGPVSGPARGSRRRGCVRLIAKGVISSKCLLVSVDISRHRREKAEPAGRQTLSREKLKALEALQHVDLKIRDLTAEAEKHPARLRQIEAERNQARVHLDATRGRLADNERARRQNEQLLQLEKEKVRKWESRLNELKTPREYAALARELDIAKKTNQGADEELKRLLVEYEDLRKQVAAGETALAEKEAVVEREGKEIRAVLDGVQAKTKELEAERASLIAACDKSLVNKYERIRK